MKIKTLQKKGFTLLNQRTYKVQTQQSGASLIVLGSGTRASGLYYQSIDKDGNILLVREENLEL